MSDEGAVFARRELADLRERYARDEVSDEELEDETHFWLKVEACPYCGHPGLCNIHYDYMYNYGMQ
jgi:hypothetical protein